ncbi:MAG: RelA/SpoT domain-containing protein [Bacteroidetes bacterium]|jgi:putative GTP pyrophosphokinase|nr:RelA/SpoT domain-containing protein [Bacteroidota bacterium]
MNPKFSKQPTLDYSRSKVNKAGRILADYDSDNPNITVRQLIANYYIMANWREIHYYPINTFQATLRKKLITIDKKAIVAQRLKRIPSIVGKLRNNKTMQLARMQDIGGIRAIVMSAAKVKTLEENYRKTQFTHKLHSSKNYILQPKNTGYRGIHLVYKYHSPRNPSCEGLFIELQFRSLLQHYWATAVETIGTYLEIPLKSSIGPKKWLEFFAIIGSAIAHIEGCPPVPEFSNLSKMETFKRTIHESNNLDVPKIIAAFSMVSTQIKSGQTKGSYHLIKLDLEEQAVYVKSYPKNQYSLANKEYADLERDIQGNPKRQIVLVSTKSINDLQSAYPNFYMDASGFVFVLNKIEELIKKLDK